jgi:ribosomal protein S5
MMRPEELVDWAISLAIGIFILSATGIQDWIAKLFGSKYTKKELEAKIAALESRIEQLEKKG